MAEHNSTFVINDIVLTIPPEHISIDRAAQIKQYKSLRTKGTAKVRSPQSMVSITLQVKFVGIDEINNKLRPLVAQFLLTPFCYVDNDYLRDSIVGNEGKKKNMALALQNLTVSTVHGQPDTWHVVFSFIWFNYRPYSSDLKFKDRLINRGAPKKVGTPGLLGAGQTDVTPFQAFYAHQLSQLRPVQLANSELSFSTLEFLIANVSPQEENETSPDIDFEGLRDFTDASGDLIDTVTSLFSNSESDVDEIKKVVTAGSSSDNPLQTIESVNNTLAAVVSIAQKRNPRSSRLEEIIKKRDNLLVQGAQVANGNWIAFPVGASSSPNRFKNKEGASKLYYRANRISTVSDDLHSGLVATTITMNFGHKLAILPMQGYQYPTAQHLGSGDVEFSIQIACLDDQTNRDFTDFWNITQNNFQYARFIPQELTSIQVNNELFKFMGVDKVLFSAKSDSTTPDHPGMYNYEVVAVENSQRITGMEQLKSVPVSFKKVRKLIWKAIWANLSVNHNGSVAVTPASAIFIIKGQSSQDLLRQILYKDLETTNSAGLNAHFAELFDNLNEDQAGKTVNDIFLSTAALTDDEVLGIEGANEAFQLIRKARNRSTNPTQFSSDQISSTRRELLGQQQSMDTRVKAINSLIDFVHANPIEKLARTTSDSLVFTNGKVVKFTEITEFPDFNEELRVRIFEKGKEFLAGLRAIGSMFAGVVLNDNDLAGNRDVSLFQSVIKDLTNELVSLRDARVGDKSFETEFLELFDEWKRYTVATADEIIDRYLDFDIFKEAAAEYKKLTNISKGTLYADMQFDKIQDYVNQQTRTDAIPIEPDFYFWNESVDEGVGGTLNPEKLGEIKANTIEYMNKINSENNKWYQKLYLEKVNPDMQKFLKDSNPSKQINTELAGDSGNPSPGLAQITQPIDIGSKSINAFTGDQKSKSYQATINKPGILGPVSTNNYNKSPSIGAQPNSAEAAMSLPVGNLLNSSSVNSQYGAWLPPLQSFAITSTPGHRTPPAPGATSQHRGTDLGFRPRGTFPPVFATLGGEVIAVSFSSSGGNYVKIRSEDAVFGEVHISYLHLSGILPDISEGMVIEAGKAIGIGGGTGSASNAPHLHFEVYSVTRGQYIYPFGSFRGDIVAALNPEIIVADLIPVSQSSLAPYLPNAGLSGIGAGLSAFDHSLQSLQAEWQRDAGYRINRAYPSIYLAFIEEDLDDSRVLKFDDYFSFSSVVSVYCVKDREVPADYLFMQLTNLSGLLSNRKFQGTTVENSPVNGGREATENRRDPNAVNTDEEFQFESLMLREGIKVELRLGYSNDPDNLEIVFIGRIVGVQFSESDDMVELEMQSLATELVQDIKGQDKTETVNGALGGLFVSDARTGPLLESLIAESPECVSFGFWERGQRDKNTNRDLLTSRWVWNPEPSSDNIFAPPSDDLDPRKFFLGSSLVAKTVGAAGTIFVASADAALLAGGSLVGAATVGLSSLFGIGGVSTAALTGAGTVGNALGDTNIAPFSALTYYLYQTTIWDVFKEMEHRHPDCIASPVPYVEKLGGRTRMTMFFGNPDWFYFARDPTGKENSQTKELKDRADELKRALETRSNGADRFQALTDFADLVDLSDTSLNFLPGITDKIKNPELDDSVLQDIDRLVEAERLNRSVDQGSIRPFRKYHLVTSHQHIIANNIKAKSSNTFNAVTINYAETEDEVDKTDQGPKLNDVEELTMKLDPLIPDEFIRESVYTYPNCQGDRMAKRYAVSHLQKGCWQIYQGDLVILGNPRIKPYDIVFVFDEYSDTYGPVQVRRVTHMFDYEHGFITIITPDLLTTITEGVMLSQLHAMGLAAEHYLGLKEVVTPGTSPLDGGQVSPWKLAIAAGTMGVASFFGAKKLLFITQFGHPVTIHPLIVQGQAMVAGFGPPGVRENEFVVNDVYEWFLTRSRAVAESWEDFKRMWDNREGILNTRGEIFSSEGLGGDSRFDVLKGPKR